ncbi:MAG: D-aminoacyl-tRNA deacylase [Acidimicrobiia bacterium]
MRVVLQRVSGAGVTVEGKSVASIGPGLVLLVGIAPGDGPQDVDTAVDRISRLRIFSDAEGKMNLSVGDIGGEVLVISQFTLYGDLSRGLRPSFTSAGAPEHARPLIERMVAGFRDSGLDVSNGVFGAKMAVDLINDGPVTFTLEFEDGSLIGH